MITRNETCPVVSLDNIEVLQDKWAERNDSLRRPSTSPPVLNSPRSVKTCQIHGINHAITLQKFSLRMHLMRVIGNRELVEEINRRIVDSSQPCSSSASALPSSHVSSITRAFHEKGVYIGTSSERIAAFMLFELQEKHRVPLLYSLQQFRRIKWQIAAQECSLSDTCFSPTAAIHVNKERYSLTSINSRTSSLLPHPVKPAIRDEREAELIPHIHPFSAIHANVPVLHYSATTPTACHSRLPECASLMSGEANAHMLSGKAHGAAALLADSGEKRRAQSAWSVSPSPLCPERSNPSHADKRARSSHFNILNQPHTTAPFATDANSMAAGNILSVEPSPPHAFASHTQTKRHEQETGCDTIGSRLSHLEVPRGLHDADTAGSTEDRHFVLNNKTRQSCLLLAVSAMRKFTSSSEGTGTAWVDPRRGEVCKAPDVQFVGVGNRRSGAGNDLHSMQRSAELQQESTNDVAGQGNVQSTHTVDVAPHERCTACTSVDNMRAQSSAAGCSSSGQENDSSSISRALSRVNLPASSLAVDQGKYHPATGETLVCSTPVNDAIMLPTTASPNTGTTILRSETKSETETQHSMHAFAGGCGACESGSTYRQQSVHEMDRSTRRYDTMARSSNVDAAPSLITQQEQCDRFYYYCVNPTYHWQKYTHAMDAST